MYSEVAWVLVSSGTQVQPQIILDPDYLPDDLFVSYDYVFEEKLNSLLILVTQVSYVKTSGILNIKKTYHFHTDYHKWEKLDILEFVDAASYLLVSDFGIFLLYCAF